MIKLNNSLNFKSKILIVFGLFFTVIFYSQTVVKAEGNKAFCIGSPINIVEDFEISDPDNSVTGVEFFFIQISSGYQIDLDRLELPLHPTITGNWSSGEGKLTLSSIIGGEMSFLNLIDAVQQVVFTSTADNIIKEKTFSLTFDDANYLLRTDHFYQFISAPDISWSAAKTAAENLSLYGRPGYLATLTSQEEADFAGKQASGAGWIGGSDEETEGVWKWVTGPEAGTIAATFWNGQVIGTTPNFENWNNGEPNDFRENNPVGEDYAHITDPSIGIIGAWNDLPNEGDSGLYSAKGYVVEYGKPGDPPLNIVATTKIYIPTILTIITEDNPICDSGIVQLSATSSDGEVVWFETNISTDVIHTGNNFSPTVAQSRSYFVAASVNNCLTSPRKELKVNVIPRPRITNAEGDLICSGTANLSAAASSGSVDWFETKISTTPIFTGDSYTTPNLTATTSYFVEANNNNCISLTRTEIIVIVDTTIPEFEIEKDTYVLCNNIGSVVLKTQNGQPNYTYVWKKESVIISGNTSEVIVEEAGNYSVLAVSESGCESIEQRIVVLNSEIAVIAINGLEIIDDSDNNSISIDTSKLGIGMYEFSLNDEFGTYKDDGFFENLSSGFYTLFIKDKNGCGTLKYAFSILEYPKFFTPNDDGKNDFWEIKGFDASLYTISEIYIYNRYGILMYKIDSNNPSWDGTYEGKKLPSNTYWFQTILTDNNGVSVEKKGSISLIRS